MATVVSESGTQDYELRDPDVRLMLQVRDGSGAAFEELVERYKGRLMTVLEHLVGRRGQAEDLCQEVFLRVYNARERYVPTSKFSTWLFTIANNLAANDLRSSSRRKEVNLDSVSESGAQRGNPIEEIAQAASGQMPTRHLDKAEMREIVRLALAKLNERQRMAVLLSKYEDMSYADIAVAMKTTPKSIKSLLSRARVSLKESLEPYMERGERPEPRQ